MVDSSIKEFLDEKVDEYNTLAFIGDDPISVPHRFDLKEDQEIAGFLAATISWGNRKVIVQNAHKMLDLMGESPFDFVCSSSDRDLSRLDAFLHRTFKGEDFRYFVEALRNIYLNHGGMEAVFNKYPDSDDMQDAISHFRTLFFSLPHLTRTDKHVSDPSKGSSAKRINMMLRWFIRCDNRGVDLGIWRQLKPSQLSCPLDVHSGGIARKLGLLSRTQNDAKALKELNASLRSLDPVDPVKYDFALFGLGIFDQFK
jgi:uncharacterized protein (TIGR02757 family)